MARAKLDPAWEPPRKKKKHKKRNRRSVPGKTRETKSRERAPFEAAVEPRDEERTAAPAGAPAPSGPRFNSRFLRSPAGWPYLLVPFIPLAILLRIGDSDPTTIFIASALGVVPTAALMGRATEELASQSGPGIGGLLNVTFGNAPELIIALFALQAGLHEVVKASIIGSIIGNILLVLGAAMFVGGWGRQQQTFSRQSANAQSSMLFLAAAALVMPAVFELVEGNGLPGVDAELITYGPSVEQLSIVVACVLIFSYVAGLFFSLRTHVEIFNPDYEHEDSWGWSARRSIVMLAIAGVAVGVMSEILVHSIADAADDLGLSQFFVGAIVIAIVGNAAEHWVAVLVARKDKMDLAVNIAIGSSAQVALFVAPVLVLASIFLGPAIMPLVFNGFEIAAVLLAVLIANAVTNEGESTWFEGLQLLLVYVVLAVAFGFA